MNGYLLVAVVVVVAVIIGVLYEPSKDDTDVEDTSHWE